MKRNKLPHNWIKIDRGKGFKSVRYIVNGYIIIKCMLAKTLCPRLSRMCRDRQKSPPPSGHGVSIAHLLHICDILQDCAIQIIALLADVSRNEMLVIIKCVFPYNVTCQAARNYCILMFFIAFVALLLQKRRKCKLQQRQFEI